MATHKSEIEKKSANKIYQLYGVKIRKDSGIPEVLDEYLLSHGMSASAYIQRAVTNQLVRDNVLPVWYSDEKQQDE